MRTVNSNFKGFYLRKPSRRRYSDPAHLEIHLRFYLIILLWIKNDKIWAAPVLLSIDAMVCSAIFYSSTSAAPRSLLTSADLQVHFPCFINSQHFSFCSFLHCYFTFFPAFIGRLFKWNRNPFLWSFLMLDYAVLWVSFVRKQLHKRSSWFLILYGCFGKAFLLPWGL